MPPVGSGTTAEWPTLTASSERDAITVYKPISGQTSYAVPTSIGNEQLDAYWTVVRLEVSSDAPPAGHDLYPVAWRCIIWIRVLTRRYCVGMAGTGTSIVRGSLLLRDVKTGATQSNNFG